MKTAIVTGVAGFIGSHLAEKLLEKNFRVIGIDCFTDYYSKEIKKNNICMCLKNKNFVFINNDIISMDLIPILKKASFVFHEAAQPGVRSSWGDAFEIYLRNNIKITQKILEAAKNVGGLEKIIMASSSSIYGNQEGIMNEKETVPKPFSPYGMTKLAAENLGHIYFENYSLPVCSLRYFTVYGPKQRPDMAFSRFIISALSKKNIAVYGTGEQTRDYTFIEDIVEANMLSMENDTIGEIINIGGGNVVSTNNVIKLLENISENEIVIKYEEKQKGDVKHTQADISKAKKILGYEPKFNLRNGLVKEYNYFKKFQNLYS